MALQGSGQISLDNVNVELGNSGFEVGLDRVLLKCGTAAGATAPTSGEEDIFDLMRDIVDTATSGNVLHTINDPNSSGTATDDNFGRSVDISGNRAIVGAPYEDAVGTSSGTVYIIDVDTGSVLHTINNPNASGTGNNDNFGYSVSISGNRAIVGAPYEDYITTSSGTAYIIDVNTGSVLHTINNPNAAPTGHFDYFGWSVSISGNRAIVGAYKEDTGGTDSGTAYILDVDTGSVLHTINDPNASGTGNNDYFGYSVSISGNRAIVGAHLEDVGGSNSGTAYIIDVNTGSVLHTINDPNSSGTVTGDSFGYSVSISENRVIVGAYGEDVGGTDSGTAYIINVGQMVGDIDGSGDLNVSDMIDFLRRAAGLETYPWMESHAIPLLLGDLGTYEQHFLDPDLPGDTLTISLGSAAVRDLFGVASGAISLSDGYGASASTPFTNTYLGKFTSPVPNDTGSFAESFGVNLAVSSEYIVVGSHTDNPNGVSKAGSTYIYNTSGTHLHTLMAPIRNTSNFFGQSVAISGGIIVIGEPGADNSQFFHNSAGRAHIFNTSGTLLHTLEPPWSQPEIQFGNSVAISGEYIVIGEQQRPYNIPNQGGTLAKAGAAHIYNTSGTLLHTLTSPTPTATGYFGHSVAISGEYIVIGEYHADPSGAESGAAHIFNTSGTHLHTLTSDAPTASSYFGNSVAISDGIIVIGEYRADSAAGILDIGKAHIFNTSGTRLHTLTAPTPTYTSRFGNLVSISGEYIVIGEYWGDSPLLANIGKAYIFNTSGTHLHTLTSDAPTAASNFGYSVSISSGFVAIGGGVDAYTNGYVWMFN